VAISADSSGGVKWAGLHSWDVDAVEARQLQRTLAQDIVLAGSAHKARTVVGLDVAYDSSSERLAAAAVVIDCESLELVEQATVVGQSRFGYEPGLFAFRELPALLEALSRLNTEPELLLCDGHGYAHTERFGLACHAGLWTQIPTIGCGKTRFIGEHAALGPNRGDREPIVENGERLGTALRTRTEVKPVYVSPGHLIGFDEAADWVLRLSPQFRLPEPIRAADHIARRALAEH